MRKNGNVILVAPRDELATQEKLELESKQQISEIEPMRVEVFQLNYQKADAVAKLLSDDKQKVLSKSGSAVPDQRTTSCSCATRRRASTRSAGSSSSSTSRCARC